MYTCVPVLRRDVERPRVGFAVNLPRRQELTSLAEEGGRRNPSPPSYVLYVQSLPVMISDTLSDALATESGLAR